MRARGLLVLTLVVAALGAFIWFYERQLPSPEERQVLAKRLLQGEAEDFHELEIRWDGAGVLLRRLERMEEGEADAQAPLYPWRLVEPFDEPAAGEAVDRLLRDLLTLDRERDIDDIDRGELGIEPPRVTVTLRGREAEARLEVGAEVPGTTTMVVALAGESRASVVPSWIARDLTREPEQWRLRRLVPGTRADLSRVSLRSGERRIYIVQRNGEVELAEPVADRVEPDLGREFLNELTGLRVERFLDPALASAEELGLAPPRGELVIELGGRAEPVRIEVGGALEDAESPLLAARHAGRLVALPGALGAHLERPVAQWQSRTWTRFDGWDVEWGEVGLAGREVVFERQGGRWVDPEGRELPRQLVETLLETVTEARAVELLTPGEASARGLDLDAPELRLTLVARDGREEVLQLGPLAAAAVPARTAGRPVALLVSRQTADGILAAASALLDDAGG